MRTECNIPDALPYGVAWQPIPIVQPQPPTPEPAPSGGGGWMPVMVMVAIASVAGACLVGGQVLSDASKDRTIDALKAERLELEAAKAATDAKIREFCQGVQ